MNQDAEVRRLIELMPASGRMFARLTSKPEQPLVINSPFPVPWSQNRPIYINFDLWQQLPKPQRDLLLLREVNWVCGVKWFKPDLYQAFVAAGLVSTSIEVTQADVVGIVAAGGLTALASWQVWRKNRKLQAELEADEAAIRVAGRRGYVEAEAASHLLSALETVAKIEGRRSLNFTELIRAQNLKAIANLSPVSVPEAIRKEKRS